MEKALRGALSTGDYDGRLGFVAAHFHTAELRTEVLVPPLVLFTALMALSTSRQEAAIARERVFSQVGTTLVTTTDPEVIHRTAVEAAHRMLGGQPGTWAAISVPDADAPQRQRVAVFAGDAPADLAGTVIGPEETAHRLVLRLETDKRIYGTLLVHAAPARLREARTSLQALAGQTVPGLANAEHAADLRHQALHDALTGLANRALLHDHLDRAVCRARRGAPLAVLLIDLDGFKQVNDVHGHATGDYLLKRAGKSRVAYLDHEGEPVLREPVLR